MVRIQFSIGLQYEVGFPGADFIFNIQASRTRQQTVIAEQLTLSQSLPTLAHTDAITHARSLRVSALPGPFNVHYQATVDLNHHVANPAQVPEVPVASLPPEPGVWLPGFLFLDLVGISVQIAMPMNDRPSAQRK